MKKKILSLAVVLMMFMGVVSASSINGDYNGNPIVKVMSNGKQLQSDEVPAMIYDGHTVVPISLLRQLGASVEWNAESYSVDVKLPIMSSNSGLQELKDYITAADSYHDLDELGQRLIQTSTAFEVVYNHYMQGTDPGVSLNSAKQSLDYGISRYNIILDRTNIINKELLSRGIRLSDQNEILNNYYQAIDYYKYSYTALQKLSVAYSKNDYNIYFNNVSKGLDIAHDASMKALQGYIDYIKKAKDQ